MNLTFQGKVDTRIHQPSQIQSGQYWDVCGLYDGIVEKTMEMNKVINRA